jgi:predicted membrane chloride channel (bestrophin family)
MLPTTVNGTQPRTSPAKTGTIAEESDLNCAVNNVNYSVYDSSNHWAVMTQLKLGSIWPKVIKYCIANVVNTVFVVMMQRHYGIDLSFSDRGHTFMSMMVSFLMVTRSNIAYSRYMEARTDLSNAMTACRELVSHAVAFTRYERGDDAKKWRTDLAKRTIKLLTAVVSALQYQNTGIDTWKEPALSAQEKLALKSAVQTSNERTPLVLAMWVQSTIASNVEFLKTKDKEGKEIPMLHANKELKLYSQLSDFVKSYHGLMKLISTPFPFPLVQMTRTFLFIWIFTLPWVLVNDLKKFPALIFTVFFITYAFVGLELVAIELDDPFGDDDIDFAVKKLALVTFQDIYIFIYDADGEDGSKSLHEFIEDVKKNYLEKPKPTHVRYTSIKAMKDCITPTSPEAGSETSWWLSDERNRSSNELESYTQNSYHPQHNSTSPDTDNDNTSRSTAASMVFGQNGYGSLLPPSNRNGSIL